MGVMGICGAVGRVPLRCAERAICRRLGGHQVKGSNHSLNRLPPESSISRGRWHICDTRDLSVRQATRALEIRDPLKLPPEKVGVSEGGDCLEDNKPDT